MLAKRYSPSMRLRGVLALPIEARERGPD